MSAGFRAAAVVGLLALSAAPAEAQRPPRSGFWLENGAGPGAVRVGCSSCPDVTTRSGSASYLRGGGSLSRQVLLGLEVFAFADRFFAFDPDGDETVEAENASIGLVVMWYPFAKVPVFAKGGVGVARGTYRLATPAGDPVRATGTGSGMTTGVGLDIPVFRWLALTANAGAYVSAIGDVILPNRVVDDVIATMYHATIAITIR
jgi:hypothetical protein